MYTLEYSGSRSRIRNSKDKVWQPGFFERLANMSDNSEAKARIVIRNGHYSYGPSRSYRQMLSHKVK
jgi:hypothetical protein